MTTNTSAKIARADVVGSLLRPAYLRQARQGVREGQVSETELRAAEDRAVQEIRSKTKAGTTVAGRGPLWPRP